MSESDSRYTKKAEILADKKISVIGYDETGQAHAMNLRDSGYEISVGVRPGKSWEKASNDGFEVFSIADATEISDIVSVTLPAGVIPTVYSSYMKNSLCNKKTLIFTDSTCLYYNLLDIPRGISALTIITPKTGTDLRKEFLAGRKFRTYAAFCQDADICERNIAKEYAQALGSLEELHYEVEMSEISCAQIFAETHLCALLETFINSGIKALGKEISSEKLITDIMAEGLRKTADYAQGISKYPPEKAKSGLYQNSRIKKEIDDEISKRIYESKSGITLRNFMLSNLKK